MAMTSVDGLVSGLNTSDIINKLMQIERQPQDALRRQLALLNSRISAYQSINTKMAAVSTATSALSTLSGWNVFAATSSNSAAVTATATTAANVGSLSFTVDKLATAGALVSSGTLSSPTATAAAGPVLVAKGGTAYGISTI